MKYILSLSLLTLISINSFAQYTLKGKVVHICGSIVYEEPFVTVAISESDSSQYHLTNHLGEFIINDLFGNYTINIRHMGSPDFEAQICVEENLENLMIVLGNSCFDHVLIGKQKRLKFKNYLILENVLDNYVKENIIKKSSKRAETNCK